VERLTDTHILLKVVRGTPEPHETAALLGVLAAALGDAATRREDVPAPARPNWRPFAGHSVGGWGRW
jgi:hypothetical protein